MFTTGLSRKKRKLLTFFWITNLSQKEKSLKTTILSRQQNLVEKNYLDISQPPK